MTAQGDIFTGEFKPLNRCLCEACTDKPARTYTRAYLWECLVHGVVKMPGEARIRFMEAFEKHHGEAAAEDLHADVVRALTQRQAVRAAA